MIRSERKRGDTLIQFQDLRRQRRLMQVIYPDAIRAGRARRNEETAIRRPIVKRLEIAAYAPEFEQIGYQAALSTSRLGSSGGPPA